MTPAEFSKELLKVGIKSKNSLKGPIFLLSLLENKKRMRDILEFGFGDNKEIDIKICGNKKYRQAVIQVIEKARIITERGEYFRNSEERKELLEDYDVDLKSPNQQFPLSNFSFDVSSLMELSLPILDQQGLSFRDTIAFFSEKGNPVDSKAGKICLNVKIPRTTMCFLVGYDEEELFISLLPKTVKTVESAHKVLKPKGLRPGWKRQGEWFFNPCTKKEKEALIKEVKKVGLHRVNIEKSLVSTKHHSGSEDHYALNVLDFNYAHSIRTKEGEILKGKTYVSGFIENERHDLLALDGWYELVVNNEIPNNGEELWD